MPKTAKGAKIYAEMIKEYGAKKGASVFYASRNKGTITGVDEWKEINGFSNKLDQNVLGDESGTEITGVGAESWVGKKSNSTGYRITAADRAVFTRFRDSIQTGLPTPRGVDQSGTGKYRFAGSNIHQNTRDAQDRPMEDLMDKLSAMLMGRAPHAAGDKIYTSEEVGAHPASGTGPELPPAEGGGLRTTPKTPQSSDAIVTARPPVRRQVTTGPKPAITKRIVTARPPQPKSAVTAPRSGAKPPVRDASPSGNHTEAAGFHERQAAHFMQRGQQGIGLRHTQAAALYHKAQAAHLGGAVEAAKHAQKAAALATPKPIGDAMTQFRDRMRMTRDAGFEESKHPRGAGGQFGAGKINRKGKTPKSFWSYQASEPTPSAPPGFKGDWESLSPGMRREIMRDLNRTRKVAGDAMTQFRDRMRHTRDDTFSQVPNTETEGTSSESVAPSTSTTGKVSANVAPSTSTEGKVSGDVVARFRDRMGMTRDRIRISRFVSDFGSGKRKLGLRFRQRTWDASGEAGSALSELSSTMSATPSGGEDLPLSSGATGKPSAESTAAFPNTPAPKDDYGMSSSQSVGENTKALSNSLTASGS